MKKGMIFQVIYLLPLVHVHVHGFLFGTNKVRQVDIDDELFVLKVLSSFNNSLDDAQRLFKNLGYAARVVQINDDSTITEFAIDSNSAVYKYGDLISWNNKSAVYMPLSVPPAKREWEMAFSFSPILDGVLVPVDSFLVAAVQQFETRNINGTVEFSDGAFISLKNVHGTQAPGLDCYQHLVNSKVLEGGLKVINGVGCHILHDSDGENYFTMAIGTDSYAVAQTSCKRFPTIVFNTASAVCNGR